MSCKAGKVCSVYFCNEYEWQLGSVSFFTFPRDKETCAEWVRLSQRADLDILLKTYGPEKLRNNKICAKHFQPSDFKNPNLTSQGLKKKAVPSLNLSGWEDEAQRRRRTSKIRMSIDNEKAEHFHCKIEGETDATCISGSMQNFPEVKTETIWVEETKIQPEEPHEFLLPLTEMVCKTEETPISVSDTLSSELAVEEDYSKLTELRDLSMSHDSSAGNSGENKTKMKQIGPVERTGRFPEAVFSKDVKEEPIIKDEKLTSPSEDARALPLLVCETQTEELVPETSNSVTSCTRISETYYCAQCDTQFRRQSDFNRHMTRTHKQTRSFPCTKCEKVFRYPSKLTEHLVVHSDDKPFSCNLCHRQFARSADQKKHMNSHSKNTYSANVESIPESSHPKDKDLDQSDKNKEMMNQKKEITLKKNDHFCFLCSEPFTSKLVLQHHKATVHRLTNAYQCLKCQESFSDLSKLVEHNSKHSSKRKRCAVSSNKKFSSRPTLTEHSSEGPHLVKEKNKNRNPKFEYSCTQCGKTFQYPSRLKDHMLTHTKEKCFTCDHCKRGFGRKSDLLYHMSKHIGQKLYSCPICQISFPSSSKVDRHIGSHSRVPLYACALCRKTFTILADLEKHVSNHFLNTTGHSCVVCHKKFAHASGLRSHMHVHLHGKSFACPLCRKHLFNSSALSVHLRKTHRRYQWKSELLQKTIDPENGLCNEVAETLDKDEIEVQSNDADGDPLDVPKSPVSDSGQIGVIEVSANQETKETRSDMVADLRVSDPNSGDDGDDDETDDTDAHPGGVFSTE